MANLNKARCTGCVMSYQNQIYVFGGYNGTKNNDGDRPRQIEKYDGENNIWYELDFKLP